jgi:hypothetical protein
MAIDKILNQAPLGLDPDMLSDEPALEIEIENPEGIEISAGGMEIEIEPDSESVDDFNANLAEFIDESELTTLGSELVGDVKADEDSRKDWVDTLVKGLEVLGLKYEERTEPWNGACGVFSALLSEAAIRFQSETIMETFPAKGPVATKIIGQSNKFKEEAAVRVKEDMNYQLTEVMTEYRPEHERLLYSLGLMGSGFKKVYYDPSLGRQVSIFVTAEDVIVPYGASNIETAPRVTHVMRKTKNEVRKLQVDGFYRDVDLGDPVSMPTDIEKKKAEEAGYSLTDDDRYTLLEIQVDLDLPGYEDKENGEPTGIALPYIVTIDKGTGTILAVRRNWDPEDDFKLKRTHFVHYIYIPGFGFYGLGLIHIIGGYARAGTMLMRQLVDAGSLANLPGGLKARGLRVKGDDTPIAPGEFRDVDIPGGAIKDNIMTLPYKEPSQTLLQLLNQIVDEGRRLGAVADMKVSDMSAQAPVGTTLALLERQLKTMSAVQARVHAAMKQEFKLLKNIIRDYTEEEYSYEPENAGPRAKKSDYDLVEVIPVSDPNAATMAQRVVQYQAVIQLAQGAPQIYNLPQLHRQMLDVLGIKDADKLIPMADDQKPKDPVSENMNALKGTPLKAFIYQDHDAHIAVHMTMLQDPKMMQMIGQSPMAQQIQGAIMAHINEHLGFQYRRQIEETLGVPLPPPEESLPEDVEVQLSQLVAQAAAQLTQKHIAEAQAQQAAQQAQDPLVQMQQQELQIKAQKVQQDGQKAQAQLALQAQKAQADAQKAQAELTLKAQQQEIERARVEIELQRENIRAQSKDRSDSKKIQADIIKTLTKPPKPSR